jgi:hypothetical protein
LSEGFHFISQWLDFYRHFQTRPACKKLAPKSNKNVLFRWIFISLDALNISRFVLADKFISRDKNNFLSCLLWLNDDDRLKSLIALLVHDFNEGSVNGKSQKSLEIWSISLCIQWMKIIEKITKMKIFLAASLSVQRKPAVQMMMKLIAWNKSYWNSFQLILINMSEKSLKIHFKTINNCNIHNYITNYNFHVTMRQKKLPEKGKFLLPMSKHKSLNCILLA